MNEAQPRLTAATYLEQKCRDLAVEITGKTVVYLDVKFWIMLREVDRGRARSAQDQELFEILYSRVKSGQIVCVMSDEILIEILKQTDPETFRATLLLVDKLTQGITLALRRRRAVAEIGCMLATAPTVGNYKGANSALALVWTRSMFVLGEPPNMDILDLEPEPVMRETVDRMWGTSFELMMEVVGIERIMKAPKIPDISSYLNSGKDKYKNQNKYFEELYKSELAGVLDLYEEAIQEASAEAAKSSGIDVSNLTEEDVSANVALMQRLIFNGLVLGKFRKALPMIHIHACLHSIFRRDVPRRFKPNDSSDFEHAMAALPYSDIFLTEKDLRNTITSKPSSLAELYECSVVSKAGDAISLLREPQS